MGRFEVLCAPVLWKMSRFGKIRKNFQIRKAIRKIVIIRIFPEQFGRSGIPFYNIASSIVFDIFYPAGIVLKDFLSF